MKNGFIFYKSFYEAINELDDESQLDAYKAIVTFALTGEEIEINGVARAIFNMAKPQIEANNKRYENGVKGGKYGGLGGRPKKNPPAEEKPQEKPEKEKKQIYGEYKHVRLTPTEYTKLCDEYGDIEAGQAITYLDEYIERKGYKAKSHYLCIRKWVFDAIKEDQQKKANIARIDQRGTADDYFRERGFL